MNGNASTLLVDIVLTTYNHGNFVAQAIESVLAQQTNFEYRLMIGDDCSTDNTQEIIQAYAAKYPERIKTYVAPKNIGILTEDRWSIYVLSQCTAKYVALLDGDDYWTSPNKLQQQVDFLESHPDFSICFHNTLITYDDEIEPPKLASPPDQKTVFTLEDLLLSNPIMTCSTLFRRGLFGAIPSWFYKVPTGDWALHIMNAQYGKIKYLNENMSVYRVHAKGMWSTRESIERNLSRKRMYQYLSSYLEPQNRPLLEIPMRRCDWVLTYQYKVSGNRPKVRAYLRKCLTQYGFSKDIPFKEYCSLFVGSPATLVQFATEPEASL